MEILVILIISTIALMLYLSIVATVHLSKTDAYSKEQKIYQYALIWLVPIIGSVVVLSILLEEISQESKNSKPPSYLFYLLALTFFIESVKASGEGGTESHDTGGYDAGGGDGGGDG